MSNLQTAVEDICRLADAVIKEPFTDIATTVANIGLSANVAGFVAETRKLYCDYYGSIPYWVVKKLIEKKEQRQEKERMLREIIRKQQAVINKLNQELAKSREQNAKNCQEIENLKQILRILEEAEKQLNAA